LIKLGSFVAFAAYGCGDERGPVMGWIVLGIVVVGLLAVALVVDLRDRGRGGKKIAGGLGEARRDDVVQQPQVGDQGTYLNLPPGS
jgi:hypothetical protein